MVGCTPADTRTGMVQLRLKLKTSPTTPPGSWPLALPARTVGAVKWIGRMAWTIALVKPPLFSVPRHGPRSPLHEWMSSKGEHGPDFPATG